MDFLITVSIAVVAVIAVMLLKRLGQPSTERAAQLIRDGAPIIDVRTVAEFSRDAVRGAINIPLDQLNSAVPKRFPDRTQVLLLHCLSGGRSMVGVRKLRGLGYANTHNLGSLGRARRLVKTART